MIVVQTPLRIGFLGGGTDIEHFYAHYGGNGGGAVLSAAINKYVFVIVKERFDDLICLNYTKREAVGEVEQLQHELVREALAITGVDKGIEITTLADVPAEGTGLGSSSSVTVGVLHALYAYLGELRTAQVLAREACHIEVDTLKKPIGKQDQYMAAYGNIQFITFKPGGVCVEKVALSPDDRRRLDDNLILFYTGVTRKSSEILSEQKACMDQQVEALTKLRGLAFDAKEAILRRDFDEFGQILHEGWELKRGLHAKISNPEIDYMYETARRAGAIGGKITGAGGGGFMLLYCPKEKQDDVFKALRGYRELPFRFECDGSKVIFNCRRNE